MSNAPAISRNDPCPCGSGKKYKHCCGRTVAAAAKSGPGAAPAAGGGLTWGRIAFGLFALLVGTIGFLVWLDRNAAAKAAALQPKPWEYNAELNQHWDPGHGHWHAGLPPPLAADGTRQAVTPPAEPVVPKPAAPAP